MAEKRSGVFLMKETATKQPFGSSVPSESEISRIARLKNPTGSGGPEGSKTQLYINQVVTHEMILHLSWRFLSGNCLPWSVCPPSVHSSHRFVWWGQLHPAMPEQAQGLRLNNRGRGWRSTYESMSMIVSPLRISYIWWCLRDALKTRIGKVWSDASRCNSDSETNQTRRKVL
jgi:hypothetical protein